MLFKVTLIATLTAQPLLTAVNLSPQLEADDEDDARDKLSEWLKATGYSVAPGTEPELKALDDSGLPPEIAAINTIADELAKAKEQLAAVSSGVDADKLEELEKKVADLTAERDDLRSKGSDLLGALDKARDDLVQLANGNASLQKLAQDEAQKVADRDSEIATLKAQLEEATKPPAPAAPPAASPPADGSTPAV